MKRNVRIFWQFFCRDMQVYLKDYTTHFIDKIVINSLLFSVVFGYILPVLISDGSNPELSTIMLCGSFFIIMLITAFAQIIGLLFDVLGDNFTSYQISILSPRLFLLERIFFSFVVNMVNVVFFFPLAKLLLRDNFDISRLNIVHFLCICCVGSLFCSCYQMFVACFLRSAKNIETFWICCNSPLIWFGGFLFSWQVFADFSPMLGRILFLNPFIYFTEGMKGAILGYEHFLPFYVCTVMLIIFSLFFMMLAWYFFRKKMDHI